MKDTIAFTASQMAEIRTSEDYNVSVYFEFSGTLFLDNGKTIEPKTTFSGYNCAIRVDETYIKSYEKVTFADLNIPEIFNKDVDFNMSSVAWKSVSSSPSGTTVISLPIPVNRDGYRAIEHFTFTVDPFDYEDVCLGWTRYSEPRIEEEKQLGYRWIYCGHGSKQIGGLF